MPDIAVEIAAPPSLLGSDEVYLYVPNHRDIAPNGHILPGYGFHSV